MNSDDSNDDQTAKDSIPEDNSNTFDDAEGENTPESDVSQNRKGGERLETNTSGSENDDDRSEKRIKENVTSTKTDEEIINAPQKGVNIPQETDKEDSDNDIIDSMPVEESASTMLSRNMEKNLTAVPGKKEESHQYTKEQSPNTSEAKRAQNELNKLAGENTGLEMNFTASIYDKGEFTRQLILNYKKEKEGHHYVETYTGKGKSEEEAKENAAAIALQSSCMLKCFRCHNQFLTRRYQTTDSPLGFVLIVCFTRYREGATIDVDNIQKFMGGTLHFTESIHYDPTKEELTCILTKTARELKEKCKKYYCFTLFIMGHGDGNGITTKDGLAFAPEEMISHFKNDKLKEFAGKPKVFFIQSCRGPMEQPTVIATDTEEMYTPIRVPKDGDIYVAYSTTEGHVAYRHGSKGSYFITGCVTTFTEKYSTMHLEDMMIDVRAKISKQLRKGKHDKKKEYGQMPVTTSTLRKPLYYIPCSTF